MPSTTYLSNPVVTINAVDMSDQCTSAVFTRLIESLESTAFGQTNRSYVGGLENSTLTISMYNSFAVSETYATLKALVGTAVTVKIKPTSATTAATNPESTLTGAYLESLPIVNGQLGALDVIDIVFTGGAYSVSTGA
jgi:hypothetical protein